MKLSIDQAGKALLAGSFITGMVRVHVPKDAKSRDPELGKRNLFFIGKEDVCIRYETTSNGESTINYAHSRHDIIRMRIPLKYPPDMSNGGNFELPFKFQIPNQLPCSFKYQGNGGYCSILYKVKIDMGKFANMEKEILVRVIAQPPSSQPVPNLVEPFSTNIKFCCCIPKGKIIVAAKADDTRVGQGEEMKVDLGIKNNSTANLEDGVEAYIKQNVSWHDNTLRNEKVKEYLAAEAFDLDQDNTRARSKHEMQEIKNAATMAGNAHGSRGLDLSDDTFRELLAAVKDGSNKVILQIPDTAINTYNGKLISVEHHLVIKAWTPFGSTNPTVSVPLQIVSPESVGNPSHSHQEPIDLPPTPSPPPMNPEGWNAGNVTSVAPSAPSSSGGNVVDSEQEISHEGFDLPPIGGGSTTYDYPSLLKEIQSSLSIRTKLQDLLKDNEWKAVIVELMPNQFLEILVFLT